TQKLGALVQAFFQAARRIADPVALLEKRADGCGAAFRAATIAQCQLCLLRRKNGSVPCESAQQIRRLAVEAYSIFGRADLERANLVQTFRQRLPVDAVLCALFRRP